MNLENVRLMDKNRYEELLSIENMFKEKKYLMERNYSNMEVITLCKALQLCSRKYNNIEENPYFAIKKIAEKMQIEILNEHLIRMEIVANKTNTTQTELEQVNLDFQILFNEVLEEN